MVVAFLGYGEPALNAAQTFPNCLRLLSGRSASMAFQLVVEGANFMP